MKNTATFDENLDNLLEYAQEIAGDDYTDSMGIVITVAFSDLRNLPALRYPKKVMGVDQPIPLKEYLAKWIDKYLKGYKGRPSQKTGKKSATFSDPIQKKILQSRLPNLSNEEATMLEEGHSLLMTIENLTGELLEEYIDIHLRDHGWSCCWGSSIISVDFCNQEGRLLQIKNSDNSENSSSSQVRNGTKIEKWHRRKSTKKDTFCWDKLEALTGIQGMSEEGFREFVGECIGNNKASIFVDDENIHLKDQ